MSVRKQDYSEQRILDRDMYVGDPHPYFAWLRAHHPVHCDPAGMWALTKHGDIRDATHWEMLFTETRPDAVINLAAVSHVQQANADPTRTWEVNLLAPAAGERLIAEGFVVKPGRTLVITRGEVHAERGGTLIR